ncbi:MAG: hypothetical protein DRI39_02860 [Chloroflexi bacterium]|nr:MAG: hypothetical protein DRI39_02860 [Chloroflexota bacterium]RLC94862.1 MAG: hypothetical protein DRI40_06960 [Chloroflexota bacterium]
MTEKPGQELLTVEIARPRPYRWSTGKYLGRLYKEAMENKRLVTNRCPKCKELLWPPQAVCGRCKVEAGEDWVAMSDKGTVIQYTYLVFPLWDPHYGEKLANPHPTATIKLDGGVYMVHFLEEKDPQKLKEGMRVQAVWKEKQEERGRGLGDILYFRTIEE